MCEMGSKNINNNNKNKPQLGCVKWVAKNINNYNKQLQLGYVKWMAKTSTTTATTMELASWVMQGRQESSVSRRWNKRG
jgi:hypothetical protein